ncbi:MAG: hypothetical protein HYY61_02240 [Deltaproteobacteria bacterium]|nr:hypothetical protein [Deltaproteobacteria bacterium]
MKYRVIVFFIFLCLPLLSCMRMGGQAPSRVAITTLEGEEYPEEISMATGMSHRFYSRAFVNTLSGEQSIGAAEQRDFLNDVAFDVIEESSPGQVIQAEPNGCLWARGPGQAVVRLSAYSLKKGQLETFVKLNVAASSPQTISLGQVSDFSVAHLKTVNGTFYGLTRNNQFSIINGEGNVVGGIQNVTLDAQSMDNKYAQVWKDIRNEGFFVSYSAPRQSQRRLSTGFFSLSQPAAPLLSFDNPDKNDALLDIRKIVAGALSNRTPVILAVTRDWNPSANNNPGGFDSARVAVFALVNQGFNTFQLNQSSYFYFSDGSSGVLKVALTDVELGQLFGDRVIQFSQGQSGHFYIGVGTYAVQDPNDRTKFTDKSDLKFMIYDGSQLVVETPISALNLGEMANKKAFSLEASFDVPQIVFIRKSDKNLIFLQRATAWKSAQLDTAVDDTFSPRLIANNEDGTLVAAWKKNNKIYLQISKDFGATWLQNPLELNASVSDLELVPLPCGGSGLVTVEGSDLNLRFFDDLFKTFSSAVKLGSGLKKIQTFRERQMIKLFYLDGGGVLRMTSFP